MRDDKQRGEKDRDERLEDMQRSSQKPREKDRESQPASHGSEGDQKKGHRDTAAGRPPRASWIAKDKKNEEDRWEKQRRKKRARRDGDGGGR